MSGCLLPVYLGVATLGLQGVHGEDGVGRVQSDTPLAILTRVVTDLKSEAGVRTISEHLIITERKNDENIESPVFRGQCLVM